MPPRLKTFKPFGESSYRGHHLVSKRKHVVPEASAELRWSEEIAQEFLDNGLADLRSMLSSSEFKEGDKEWLSALLGEFEDLESSSQLEVFSSDIKEKVQEFRKIFTEAEAYFYASVRKEKNEKLEKDCKAFIREDVPELARIISATEFSDEDEVFLKECSADLDVIDHRESWLVISPELLSGIEGVRDMYTRAMTRLEQGRAFANSIEGFSEKFSVFLPKITVLEKHMARLGRGSERLPVKELALEIYEITQEYFSLYDDMDALLKKLHAVPLVQTEVMTTAVAQLETLQDKLDEFGEIYKQKLSEQKPQRRSTSSSRSSQIAVPKQLPGEEADDWRAHNLVEKGFEFKDRVGNILREAPKTEDECEDFLKESRVLLRLFDQYSVAWRQHEKVEDTAKKSRIWREAFSAYAQADTAKKHLLSSQNYVVSLRDDLQKIRSADARRLVGEEQGEEFARQATAILERFEALKSLSRDSRRKNEVLLEMKELSVTLEGFFESWENIARPFLVDFPANEELSLLWRKTEDDYRKIKKEKLLFDAVYEDFLEQENRQIEQAEMEKGKGFLDGCRQALMIAKGFVNARPVNAKEKDALQNDVQNFLNDVAEFTATWDSSAAPYFERPAEKQAAVWQTAKKEYGDFLVFVEKLGKNHQKFAHEKIVEDEKRLAAQECEKGSVVILETLDRLKNMPQRPKKAHEAFRQEVEQFLHLYGLYQEYWFEFIEPRVVEMKKEKTFTSEWRSALSAREAVMSEVVGLLVEYRRSFGEDVPSLNVLQSRVSEEIDREDEERRKKHLILQSIPEPVKLPPVEIVHPVVPLAFAPNDASLDALSVHKELYPEEHVSLFAKKIKKAVGKLLGLGETEDVKKSEKMITIPAQPSQMTEAVMNSLVERYGKDAVSGASEYLDDIHPMFGSNDDINKES